MSILCSKAFNYGRFIKNKNKLSFDCNWKKESQKLCLAISKLWYLVMDREAWHDAIHGVTKSQVRLSDWTELIANFKSNISLYF